MPADAAPEGEGRRRPTENDLQPVLDLVSGGMSLKKACEQLGLHQPSTHAWLAQDDARRDSYARAREARADHYQEQVLDMGMAAATGQPATIDGQERTIDPVGYRAYVDTVKWATARMAPKTAPVQRHAHTFENLTDEEIEAQIAARLAAGNDAGAEES